MRSGPSTSALASAASWVPKVTSWLGAALLAEDVPISSGRVVWNASAKVPDSLTIVVPRYSAGRDWMPTTATSPLARYGQQLDVTVMVAGVDVRLGRFQIIDWDYDEATITVKGAGLLQIAADSRLLDPTSPRDDATLKSEFVRLLPEQMAVQFDPALVNRSCPVSMSWDEERIDALYDIVAAWPAVIRMDSWGQVLVKPPVEASTPELTLTDGVNGTVVSVPRSDTRDGVYNIVKASSSADGVEASATAAQTSGPMAVQTYNPVPRFFSSPLLTTEAECIATAQALLATSMRRSSVLNVTMAPDPRIELDDSVEVLREGFRDWGVVLGVDMPLTVRDGEMRVDVGVF